MNSDSLSFFNTKVKFTLLHYYVILDNFSVMERLIDLLRRSGKLDKATYFFEMAKKKSTRVLLEPGYNYCKGLYCW